MESGTRADAVDVAAAARLPCEDEEQGEATLRREIGPIHAEVGGRSEVGDAAEIGGAKALVTGSEDASQTQKQRPSGHRNNDHKCSFVSSIPAGRDIHTDRRSSSALGKQLADLLWRGGLLFEKRCSFADMHAICK